MTMNAEERAWIKRQFGGFQQHIANLVSQLQHMQGVVDALESLKRPYSISEEIDEIPGRRVFYTLVGRVDFTIDDLGKASTPVNFQVSQDGPFVQTHYPFALWLPSSPATATNLGRWRPVSHYPLPTQEIGTDFISISYQVTDGGSDRQLQSLPVPPLLSTPDNVVPLPVPTFFSPNANIQFKPTYEDIQFDGGVPPDTGTLVVALPGFRAVNM